MNFIACFGSPYSAVTVFGIDAKLQITRSSAKSQIGDFVSVVVTNITQRRMDLTNINIFNRGTRKDQAGPAEITLKSILYFKIN